MSKSKFPTTRPKQIALAQAMISGFTTDTEDFPAPTVAVADLQAKLDTAQAATNARTVAESVARESVQTESGAYDDLIEAMKTDIRYAELVTNDDDVKLQKIGWSGRAAPTALQPPNAPRSFEIVEQGRGFAHFDWKDPLGGGAVKMFRVMMMEVGGTSGTWTEAASAVDSEAVVTGLAGDGKEYIFCAVAVNTAGTSGQSNTVTAFL